MAGGKSVKKTLAWTLAVILCAGPVFAGENEILEESGVKVFVREHPQTGKPFVSLRKEGGNADPFKGFVKREIRPDYRMLDPKTRSGDVPYDGPVSDRKKVYIFAATMMTLGVAGGIATAAIPVTAAASGASGGTGILGAGAVTVLAGTAGTVALKSHLDPGEENYIHEGTTLAASQDPKKLSLRDVLREIDAEEKTSVI
jgi:hypothetical protein